MSKFKKYLALTMCAAMMIPSSALAASSPAKVDVKSATAGETRVVVGTENTIVVDGKTLVKDKDFKVTKGSLTADKAGDYEVTIEGIGSYTGTATIKYAAGDALKTVKLAKASKSVTYNGKKKTAKIVVKNAAGKTLKAGTDYTVSTTSFKNAGTYTITVTGIGNYAGTSTVTYKIAKAKQSKVKVKIKSKKVKVSGVKAKAKVTYKSNNKKVKVSKKGKITVSKKVKKGTKVKITVKVAATKNYKSYKKTITYTVK